MKRSLLLVSSATALFILSTGFAYATHITGADIMAKRISATSLTYDFTITGYRDIGSPVEFSDGEVHFGDGTMAQLDLAAKSMVRTRVEGSFLPHEQITLIIEHTYNTPGSYMVGYLEPTRNDGIINIGNSVNARFYLETQIVIDPVIGPNSSPIFQTIPLDQAFVGVGFTHNPWALDADGDSLAYKLTSVKQDFNTAVQNYRSPNGPEFYQSPIDYHTANEAGSGPPTFSMDPFTGILSWDTPGNFVGTETFPAYNIAFIVEEWRKLSGSWRRIGFVTRDMQILVSTNAMGSRPNGDIPEKTPLVASTIIDESFQFSDPDGDSIVVETYSDLYDLQVNPAIHSDIPESYQPGPISVSFDWSPSASQILDRPYFIHFKVTDKTVNESEPAKVTYVTWRLGGQDREVVTSLDDPLEKELINLYPNPGYDRITLKMGKSTEEKVNLYICNHLGQTLYRTSAHGDQIELDISAYKPGVYLLYATSKNIRWTKRFIKL